MILVLAQLLVSQALASDLCTDPTAKAEFGRGMEAQKTQQTDTALAAYQACLAKEPGCIACQYEIGWSYWAKHDWKSATAAWEATLKLDADHAAAKEWLPQAKAQAEGKPIPEELCGTCLRVPIGTASKESGRLQLKLVARYQNFNAHPSDPADHYDPDINSPKSATFLANGTKVYVNSLEGFATVVYDPKTLAKLKVVTHRFDKDDSALFAGKTTAFGYEYKRKAPTGDVNVFAGKPVESMLSHEDRYLWVPYYRRDWDDGAMSPSAVGVIDTQTDSVVRVIETGPLPKYAALSPDGTKMAITHWGDNTLGIVDIASPDPLKWDYLPNHLVVEKKLSMDGLEGKDRDGACGHCLRGTVFTPDGSVLLVGRMASGGIAGFDAKTWEYLGTVTGDPKGPRHMVITKDGSTLMVSGNSAGAVSKIPVATVIAGLRSAKGGKVPVEGWSPVSIGGGVRTIALSPDGKTLYAASNSRSEVVAVDVASWAVIARVRTDSYTVGLDVSPDGKQVWTTSQGHNVTGGKSVNVFEVVERSP